MTKRLRSAPVPTPSAAMPSHKSSSSSSKTSSSSKSKSSPSLSSSKPAFVPPSMAVVGTHPSQNSSKCLQTMVRGTRTPGFPAAEQLDVFLHEARRAAPKRDAKKSTHQSSAGPARRRCRPPARALPRQADCFVELCPPGSHEVVMHPGF